MCTPPKPLVKKISLQKNIIVKLVIDFDVLSFWRVCREIGRLNSSQSISPSIQVALCEQLRRTLCRSLCFLNITGVSSYRLQFWVNNLLFTGLCSILNLILPFIPRWRICEQKLVIHIPLKLLLLIFIKCYILILTSRGIVP